MSWSSALQPVRLLLSIAVTGDAARWNSADEDNFTQAGLFYRMVTMLTLNKYIKKYRLLLRKLRGWPEQVLSAAERERLCDNIASHLAAAQDFLQERAISNFAAADPEYGARIKELIHTKALHIHLYIVFE